jgi:glyoxylase-like metal-dependent hydrolase (beta-lactamase superfamily II)
MQNDLHNAGIHSIRIGTATVTALNDGQFQASTAIVNGVTEEAAAAAESGAFRVLPPRITISSFLLELDGRKMLIDTGCGSAFGPAMGRARAKLDTLGIKPADISSVIVTHAHVDHISGLVDPAGQPWYPNAEIVINGQETAFWLDNAKAAAAPDAAKDAFATAQGALRPYAARTRTVSDGQEGIPGLICQHLPGHTPGHSGWLLSSGGETLLIWGDVVHLPGIQFALPEAGLAFDTDSDQARLSRRRAMDMAATDRLLVAGMHLEFPTFGHVVKSGAGYAFVPVVWRPDHDIP